MQTIKLNPQLLSELFELISILSDNFNKEFFGFQLFENSLTFRSYTSIEEPAELDDTIANWMDHSSVPELLENFNWKTDQENKSFILYW